MEERLIALVQNNRFLWDMGHPSYINRKLKEITWALIGQTVNISGDDARKKFKHLRERYLREKKIKLELYLPDGGPLRKKWHHYEAMSFLDPVIRHRNNTNSETPSMMLSTSPPYTPNQILPPQSPFDDHATDSKNTMESTDGCLNLSTTHKPLQQLTSPLVTSSAVDPPPISPRLNVDRMEQEDLDSTISEALSGIFSVIHQMHMDNKTQTRSTKYKDFGNYFIKELEELPEDIASHLISKTMLNIIDAKNKINR